MPDPLAGYRESINRGECDAICWPDDGKGCPVKEGQTFKLRSCTVRIASIRRLHKGRRWYHRAVLTRYYPDRIHLLSRNGYTSDPRMAVASGEPRPDWQQGPALVPEPEGPPPEPEGPPDHEIRTLPTSVAARHRYAALKREELEQRIDRSLTSQLREARIRARATGADISDELAVILDATDRAMRKSQRAA